MNVPFHVGVIFMFYVCFPGGKANSRVSSFLSGTDCIPPMCVYIGTHPEIRKLILLQVPNKGEYLCFEIARKSRFKFVFSIQIILGVTYVRQFLLFTLKSSVFVVPSHLGSPVPRSQRGPPWEIPI